VLTLNYVHVYQMYSIYQHFPGYGRNESKLFWRFINKVRFIYSLYLLTRKTRYRSKKKKFPHIDAAVKMRRINGEYAPIDKRFCVNISQGCIVSVSRRSQDAISNVSVSSGTCNQMSRSRMSMSRLQFVQQILFILFSLTLNCVHVIRITQFTKLFPS